MRVFDATSFTMRVCVFAAAAIFSIDGATAVGATDYFPPSFSTPSLSCYPNAARREPVVNDIENRWYSDQLQAAHEPSFYADSLLGADHATAIRFTWLRSFHAPVLIRIEMPSAGEPQLIAKQLSGKGGYSPGSISKLLQRPLTSAESSRLQDMIRRTAIFAQSPKECGLGVDGAEWLVEAHDRAGYHFVGRWSPTSGPVRDVGVFMMKLTGWNFGELY